MGISRSELFLGFYRCFAEWKSPLIRSFVPEPDHRHSAQRQQRALMLVPFYTSWIQGDTLGKSEMMILQSLWWSQVLTSVPNRISPPKTLFSIWQMIISSKWFMTIVSKWGFAPAWLKPFGSLQVVIRLGEWQAAGSRIRQARAFDSRCQNCPFDMIYNCHFEMIYDSLFESRAVSIGRSQIETARRRGRRAVISRA